MTSRDITDGSKRGSEMLGDSRFAVEDMEGSSGFEKCGAETVRL